MAPVKIYMFDVIGTPSAVIRPYECFYYRRYESLFDRRDTRGE